MIFNVETKEKQQFIDVTDKVRKAVHESGVKNGFCLVYCPHTTAAVTINENADPSVQSDMKASLNDIVRDIGFKHREGNSNAHVKSSLIGAGETLIIEDGEPVLGTWQAVYFCEFDGPRDRKLHVKIK